MAKGEWNKTTRVIRIATEILEQENPMTIRQLFYRLVSIREIENDRKSYQRVSVMMTKAREDDRCPYEWIADRSRPEYCKSVWDNPADYAETIKVAYHKDYWALQPNHVEVWVEKDAIIGSIEDVTNELGVLVRVGRGFISTTKAHDIATSFAEIRKPKTVFYLGDHDPSGRCIETEAQTRVRQHLHQMSDDGSTDFEVIRLAIHPEDIRKFKVPPLRIKTNQQGDYTDSRAESFLAEYGDECVELDALPPAELRKRIRKAVELKMDMAAWRRSVMIEQVEVKSIVEMITPWLDVSRAAAEAAERVEK